MTALYYMANMRFPTERAHGIQVAKMCEAFARSGANVTLLVPDRKTIQDDPFTYYGLERNFTIEKIPVPDIVRFGTVGFLVESFLFALRATRRALQEKDAIIYTREELPLLLLPAYRAFYEAHQLRRSSFFLLGIKRAKGIISITQGLKDALVRIGVPEGRIFVAHDGYDERQFSLSVTRAEARGRLSLPLDGKIAMYIGGFEVWKGVDTLCKSAEFLKKENVKVVVIGGTAEEKEKYSRMYPLVTFLGARPYTELAVNQQAADILVVPNSANTDLGSKFTSPLKLFAHMASGVALVVADTPSLKEVVDPTQIIKFTPDNPESLAYAIRKALSSEWLASWISKEAGEVKKRAKEFTWDERAKNVLAYMYDN